MPRVNNQTTTVMLAAIRHLSQRGYDITEAEVRMLISLMTNLFRKLLLEQGFTDAQIRPLTTKFRDAGRRSAPWKAFSGRVPGRPQDGADGNRIRRWSLPPDHKFYADEINATLVEVKYYLQALSMVGAPPLPPDTIQTCFNWLVDHPVEPGNYLDPIQLIPISLIEFIDNPRSVQSGHLIPLDREGRHVPDNAFLMLGRSNQIQGNQTVDELFALMQRILERHRAKKAP